MNTIALQHLEAWIKVRIPAAQWQWLEQQLSRLSSTDCSTQQWQISYGLIPRKLERKPLTLDNQERQQAAQALPGWEPVNWSIDSASRILFLCRLAQSIPEDFPTHFKSLCQTADLNESITLYSGTALYPYSDLLNTQIGEGLRTHIQLIFEAIAHRNPFAQQHFNELRWNHMVLKALFIDSTLWPIVGLDERVNPELARILCDYAHERWAAKRVVTPELWRCVGPFAEGEMLNDLERALNTDNLIEKQAALLALSQSSDPRAATVLAQYPQELAAIHAKAITWDSITQQLHTP